MMPILNLNRFEKPFRQALASLFFLFFVILIAYESKGQVKADFSFFQPSSCIGPDERGITTGITIRFKNESTGSGLTYSWQFEPSKPPIIKPDPEYTFDNPGVYRVLLEVSNGTETDSKDTLIVIFPAPRVNFIPFPISGCAPLKVNFSDQTLIPFVKLENGSDSLDNIIKRTWTFEGGTPLPDNNPNISYTFSQAGNPSVNLRIETQSGCVRTIPYSGTISVFDEFKASFAIPPATVCKFPFTVQPQIISNSSISSYTWSVTGPSPVSISNSTADKPNFVFQQPGRYKVFLTLVNLNGCSKPLAVDYDVPPPLATSDFQVPSTLCSGSKITFKNESLPAASSSTWYVNGVLTSSSSDFSQTFTTPGNYAIRLEAQIGPCLISTLKTITINPLPTISFDANGASEASNCTAPFNVSFTDLSSGGIVSRTWNFGDNSIVSQSAPFASTSTLHTYNSLGRFNVSITASNSFGCVAFRQIDEMVVISKPEIQRTNLPDSGCAPLLVTPDVSFAAPSEIASWNWRVINAASAIVYSSTLPNPTPFTLTNTGVYTITLNVTSNSGCTSPFEWNIKVGLAPPPFTFNISPTVACANEFFSFTYNGADATGYKWKFGNNDSSLEKNVSRQFKKLGKYDVSLTVFGDGCARTSTIQTIEVKGVVASFSPLQDCSKPLERFINDQSSGSIQQWEWNFGDGSTESYSTSRGNFIHTYAKSGPYTITLNVTGGGCKFSDTAKIFVANENRIDFLPFAKPVCISDTFLILNAALDDPKMIKSISWDLGCGYGGSKPDEFEKKIEISSLCKYPDNFNRGLYAMRIRIVDVNDCIYESPVNEIFVGGSIADFKPLTPITGCANLPVKFQDLTSSDGKYDILSRTWNFGDGSPEQDIQGPVQHIFTKTGSFEVRLTTLDQSGCISMSKSVTITTSSPAPDFTSSVQAGCVGGNIQFSSTGSFKNYYWDFNDGTLLDGFFPDVFHSFSSTGSKTISLRVIDDLGCEAFIEKKDFIGIDVPNVSFTVDKLIADCPPFKPVFTFTGSYVDKFEWKFGDGSTSSLRDPIGLYSSPGTYTVKLTGTSPGGCAAPAVPVNIVVNGPTGTARVKPFACEPFIAEFTVTSNNAFQVRIDYNNGEGSLPMPFKNNYSYTYSAAGNYTPKIFLINDKGCEAFIPNTGSVKVVDLTPNFRFDKNIFCDEGEVTFTDLSLSNDVVDGWEWDFGDGNTGVGNEVKHFYKKPGTYPVILTATTELGCSEKSTITIAKTIFIQERPDMGISTSKLLVCEDDQLLFKAIELPTSSSTAKKWFWDFTNGISSTLKESTQQFRKAGIYPIRLYAANDKGCWDTVLLDLKVNAIPKLDAGLDTYLCFGTAIQLNPSGADTYEWFGSAILSCGNCPQPFVNPDQDAIFFVRGTSAEGCSAIDSIKVKVIQPQTLVAPLDTFVCFGGFVKLQASGTDSYQWSPSLGLSDTKIADPIAKPNQTTVYTVTGKDAFNCFNISQKVNVRVIPNPIVDAGRDTTVKAGYPLRLEPTFSPDVTRIEWVPKNFLSCSNCKNPEAELSFSTTYTVFVYTKEGCVSKDVINVFATCTKENIFIPNTFSPNGDGYNEIFYPRSRGVERIKSMKIFSRWGQLVYVKDNFIANDQLSGWNGKRYGNYVTPDVYVYIIDLICENGSIITIKGDVTLIR